MLAHRLLLATDSNSILELVVGPYGIGRFVRHVRPAAVVAVDGDMEAPARVRPSIAAERPPETGPRTGAVRAFIRARVGPLRLADGQLAGQAGWLLPLSIIGVVLGASWRRPLTPAHLAIVLWSAWALTYGVVFSAAGGIMHYYYLSTMAPPLAALAGIGVVGLWHASLRHGWRAALLPTTLVITAVWQLYVDAHALGGWRDPLDDLIAVRELSGTWRSGLHLVLSGAVLIAAVLCLVVTVRSAAARLSRSLSVAAFVTGMLAVLALPTAWALSSVLVPGPGILPSADLGRLVPGYTDARPRRALDPDGVAQLTTFLQANRRGERYLLATSTVMLAAPLIIHTGEPVMARGGFHGLDPIVTPDTLAAMVAANQLRFVMLNDFSLVSRRMGAEAAARPIAEWVRANGTLVEAALWRTPRRSAMALYDLRPEVGLVSVKPTP